MRELVVQILDSHEQHLNLILDLVQNFEELADGKEDRLALMLARGELSTIKICTLRSRESTIAFRNSCKGKNK